MDVITALSTAALLAACHQFATRLTRRRARSR